MILTVTGTGTGVGKTHVSRAICSLAVGAGARVAYLKVAQTGVPGDVPDIEVVRSSGVSVTEGARFRAAMSPEAAARVEGRNGPSIEEIVDLARGLHARNDLLVVEGAGGILVRMAASGWTLADLCLRLSCPAIVVAAPTLGTLNATALTLEALARREIELATVVLNQLASPPDELGASNAFDLAAMCAPAPLVKVSDGHDGQEALRPMLERVLQ